MADARKIQVRLNIPPAVYESYYHGTVREVVAVSVDGRRLRFPANILQSFVLHDGVNGLFEIEFNQDNKFVAIRRIEG